jgi:hypothetical protein
MANGRDRLLPHVKANHGRERDPVCVFAVNIAAVNQINSGSAAVAATPNSRTALAKPDDKTRPTSGRAGWPLLPGAPVPRAAPKTKPARRVGVNLIVALFLGRIRLAIMENVHGDHKIQDSVDRRCG